MKSVVSVLFCLWLPGTALGQSEASLRTAEGSITSLSLFRHIEVLAHDSMRGRATPSPELDSAAEYVATEFHRIGLLPGAPDGGFIQRYPLVRVRSGLAVSFEGQGTWEPGADVIQNEGGATDGPISGPLVVVTGAGDLPQSEAIRGAVVMMAARWEAGLTEPSQRLLSAIQDARPGVVIVAAEMPDRLWAWAAAEQLRPRVMTEGSLEKTSSLPPTLFTRIATAREVLARHGIELGTEGPTTIRTIQGLWCTAETSMNVSRMSAPNVVGILEGSDPTARGEYVVLSAHLDHLGVGSPVEGDSIRNGADDNASGVAAMIAVAEATAGLESAPRRSIIFLAVSGEERGLWGSAYFADHPPVPLARIVGNVNADMLGRSWADTIAAIGRERSSLGETLDQVAGEHPELDMAVVGDLWPDEDYYARSDQFSFAQKGIPALWLFSGPHEDYHGVGDEVGKIGVEKVSRITKLMFHFCLAIANGPERPSWR